MNTKNEHQCSRDVAIIGMGFKLPGENNSPLELWSNLKSKKDCITKDCTIGEFPRVHKNHIEFGELTTKSLGIVDIKHWKEFDPLFFGLNPSEVNLIDPQQRVILKCTWEAFEDAGIDPSKVRGTDTSVFIGCSTLEYQNNLYNDWDTAHNMFSSSTHSMSNRISYCFDFRGESLTLDTACSSSGVAIHLGYKSIIDGSSDYSIVGGSNLIINPTLSKSESYLNMLSPTGTCHSFDSSADGFVRSEGSGIFILKRLSLAIEDGDPIYCVLKSSNSNEDGAFNKSNFYAPSKESQSKNIEIALKKANLEPHEIDYIEAHGTGTPVGDPIEVEGISMALNDSNRLTPLLIGSVKSNVGHLEAASCIPSLAKCCLMFKYGQYLPNINFNNLNPNIKLDEWNLKIVLEQQDFKSNNKPINMAINNFGITGSNVCLILSEYKIPTTTTKTECEQPNNYLIPITSNSKKSLEFYRSMVIKEEISKKLKFNEMVVNQINRPTLCQRMVIKASNMDQFKSIEHVVATTPNNKSQNLMIKHKNAPIVFVFVGQGPQYITMGKELYDNESIFRDSMNKIDKLFEMYFGYSNLAKLRSIDPNDKITIHLPIVSQPCLFMIQVSLFNLYKHWGIHPSIIVGHSFGEMTAAYCAGMVDLETACYVISKRAMEQHRVTTGSGKMLTVNISADEYNKEFKPKYPLVDISCYNSTNSIVLGGEINELNEISSIFKSRDIFTALLGSNASYHTKSQDYIKQGILSMDNFNSKQPTIPIFSTVTTQLFSDQRSTTPPFTREYVFANARQPVLFGDTLTNIFKYIETNDLGSNVMFLEVSPHPTLSYHIKQMIPKDSSYFNSTDDTIKLVLSLNRNKNDMEEILKSISQIYCNGYNVDFYCQLNNKDNYNKNKKTHNSLPKYQWDEQSFWKESETSTNLRNNGPSIDTLGKSDSSSIFKSMKTYIDINRKPFSYLKGHQVRGKYYFPGTGYIHNIIDLFIKSNSYSMIEIQNLEFKVPLIFIQGQINCLHTTVTQTSKTEYKSNFNFLDNKTNQWVTGSTGKFQLYNNSNSSVVDKLNIQKLKSQCNYATLNKDEFYQHIKEKTGLTYSGAFQRVENCSYGDNCSFIKLSIEPYINESTDLKTFFNPSILDCCLHGTLASKNSEFSQLVFDRIENCKVFLSNIPTDKSMVKHIYVYSKSFGRIGDSYYSSATVCLDDGTVLIKAGKVVLTSLVPIKDQLKIENPDDALYSFYLQSKDSSLSSKLDIEKVNGIGHLMEQVLSPIVNEKMIFRILDFSFSTLNHSTIINQINSCLNANNNSEIDIEYTIVKNSNDIVELPILNIFSSLLFKEINFNENFQIQNFKPSYYDIVIYNVENGNDNKINFILNQCYSILSNKGYFIVLNGVGNGSIIMNSLKEIGYETLNQNQNLIQCQKQSILSKQNNENFNNTISYDQVLVYGFDSQKEISDKIINNHLNINKSFTSNVKEFEKLVSNNSLVYFIKTIDSLTTDNFKQVTTEYINLIQTIVMNEHKNCKIILVSTNSSACSMDPNNYLNASVLGSFKYFLENKDIDLYSFDFDISTLVSNDYNISIYIENLSNGTQDQKEFIIRESMVYYERMKKLNNISKSLRSTSYEGNDNLMIRLDANLEYELCAKELELHPDEVEVKVMAVGINYKDNLIYRGLVPMELRSSKSDGSSEFGLECAGIISRVGCNVDQVKVGDHVFARANNSTSSHAVVHVDLVYHKPTNVSFVECSSMLTVYLTAIHSLLKVGNLDIEGKESILIHSATGGVGIAALNILKWKGFNSKLYVTVGSDEKRQYLINNYGDIITNIYSTRNMDFVDEINEQGGVDLILNTMGVEYLSSNFKCLNAGGRLIDLSVSYLDPNEYTDLNKFKYNISYHNVEMTRLNRRIIKDLMKTIGDALSNGQIKPIPTKEFSISEIKDAIEYINERKHIGKLVVNMDTEGGSDKITKELIVKRNKSNEFDLLKSNYQINGDAIGKTVLVTGQTGLVLEILKWIIKFSPTVENIIVLSRSSMKWELKLLISQCLANKNCAIKFYFKSTDIANYQDVNNSLNEISIENGTELKVDSIFHYAVGYNISNSMEIDFDHIDYGVSAKSVGAFNLHTISIERGWSIKQFMMASSITATVGGSKICSYVAANNVLDALARHRKSIGLVGTSVNWGPFTETGFVSKTTAIADFMEGYGFETLSINTFLGTLDLLIQNSSEVSNMLCSRINDTLVDSIFPLKSKFDFFTNRQQSGAYNGGASKETTTNDIKDTIIQRLSESLSIQTEKINVDLRLVDYGADSLIVVQFKNFCDKTYISNLFTIAQLQKFTINNIIQTVTKALSKLDNNGSGGSKLLIGNNKNSPNSNEIKDNIVQPFNTSVDQKYSIEYWKNEIKLDESIKPKQPFETYDLESSKDGLSILFTGVTGYLGVYCLMNLLVKSKNCTSIYCLIRKKPNQKDPMDIIISNLKHHLLYDKLTSDQLNLIVPVYGDLSEPMFGLSLDRYNELSKSVNLVISCGADTNFVAPYSESKLTNVYSTIELIKFACAQQKTKRIVYISTVTTLLGLMDIKDFQMLPPIEHLNEIYTGYAQSKIVCEYLLESAADRGIPSIVIRPPDIFSNQQTGIGNTNDIIQLLLQCCYTLKSYPYDMLNQLNNAPIDWVGENIINIILSSNCWSNNDFRVNSIYQLNNNYSTETSSLSGKLRLYNVIGLVTPNVKLFKLIQDEYSLEPIKFDDWKLKLNQSKEECCIRINTFHRIVPSLKITNDDFNCSEKTIELIESLGSNFNDSIITLDGIKNLLKFNFKNK